MARLKAYIDDNLLGVPIFNVGEPTDDDSQVVYLDGAGEAVVNVPADRSMVRYIADQPFFVTRDREATVPSAHQPTNGMTYVPSRS